MSSIDYTTDELLETVKRYGAIPEYQPGFDAPDILKFLNDEMQLGIVPMIISADQDFFVRYIDYDMPADSFTPIRLTQRIHALKAREVKLVDSTGVTIANMRNMTRAEFENFGEYDTGYSIYFQGNNIYVINPDSYSGKKLRVYYIDRPNTLVDDSECGLITAINTSTKTVTVNTLPSDFTTSINYDFVMGTPHFDIYDVNKDCSAIASTDMTFTDALPSDLAIGDWVCQTGFSVVANIPYELQDLLCIGAALRIQKAQGDSEAVEKLTMLYEDNKKNSLQSITPRIIGERRIINNTRGFI